MGRLVRQWIASISGCLSVAISGTLFAWMTPLMVKLVSEGSPIPMTTDDSSWLTSFIEFGQLLTTIPIGILADRVGRKVLILSTGPLSLLTWILVVTTKSIAVLYIVRFLQGVVLSISFTVVPMYIAEIAEPRVRGILGGQFKTMWYVGTLYCYSLGPYLSYDNYAFVCAILPVGFLATFSLVPESPYYLLMCNKNEEAAKSLKWLRGENAEYVNELKSIKNSVDDDMNRKGSWKDLFATRKDRIVFLIVQIVCIAKMFNGMPAILMYATQTFSQEFTYNFGSDVMTIIFGATLLFTTFFASFVTDNVGRRPLLLISSGGCTITNLVTAIIYYLEYETDIDVSSVEWLAYLSIIAFCIVCNIGLGPLMTTIQAEYFPSHIRGIGGAITEMIAASGAFMCIKQYQVVNDNFGIHTNFFIFFVFSLIGTLLIYKFLPETAGKSLGQIQKNFNNKNEVEN